MRSHSLTMELHREDNFGTRSMSTRVQKRQSVTFRWLHNYTEKFTVGWTDQISNFHITTVNSGVSENKAECSTTFVKCMSWLTDILSGETVTISPKGCPKMQFLSVNSGLLFRYAMYRKTNDRTEMLHYPANMQTRHRRPLTSTLMSPRKGSHAAGKILESETASVDLRLICQICKRKSSFKCMKCSSDGHPLDLCSSSTQRQCWNQYHVQREFDLQSSQSQKAED